MCFYFVQHQLGAVNFRDTAQVNTFGECLPWIQTGKLFVLCASVMYHATLIIACCH